jgi:putative ABC transport system permease protein
MGDPPKALLGDRYWHRRFGGDANLSKLSVRAEGESGAVVGVMPASFQFPDRRVDLWSPVFMDAPWLTDRKPASAYWTAVGRLKPGVTLDQARADLLAVQARLAEQFPETDRALDVRIIPLKQMVLGDIGRSLWLLFAAVSIVLVIACANIAALLLARASARQRDLAVRFTLGASRAIVMAQLLAETALLAFAGALLGLAVASGITKSLARLAPEIPRVAEVRIGMQDIGYVLAAAAFVSLLCGLIPAIRSSRGEQSLSGTARTQFAPRHSIQWILVGVQVALAVTLLTGAGVLLRSFDALSRVQPGFEPTGVLAFRVTGRWTESYNYDRVIQRINAWLDDLATLPGATSTATARWLPGVLSEAPPPVEFVQVGGAANDALRAAASILAISRRCEYRSCLASCAGSPPTIRCDLPRSKPWSIARSPSSTFPDAKFSVSTLRERPPKVLRRPKPLPWSASSKMHGRAAWSARRLRLCTRATAHPIRSLGSSFEPRAVPKLWQVSCA